MRDTSYSWSTNIAGRKRWRFFAPADAALLRRFPEQRTSELASTFKDMERRRALGELGAFCDGFSGWPGWEQARLRVYVIEQELNHNWCNAYNLRSMYIAMENEVRVT
ncbi:hypothetical protein MGL_1044 [Malassezia globosa CBS 7966]|uniref:Uncharacterized protein n=1 Tax=Malassezia globosa (strain ATCC MYA-4612 / CBS 7966) TaxID=425265 RepID=A8PW81_MALGO|nr:uncharacterized protein MGL_1044 [Malassezia globosa CBS 7966]EDP44562.1 hypothetical protein MGL_1044 [Malassezia globosa CBS 7966]